MAEASVWDRFEVQLSDDILKNLQDPEKAFQQDLKPQNRDESENSQLKRPNVGFLLDKMAGGVVKIIVTVYKMDEKDNEVKETEQAAIQTDVKPTGVILTQTEEAKMEETSMQTDKKDEESKQQQTDKSMGLKEISVQTEKKPAKTQPVQTEKKSEKTQQQQTEKSLGKNQQQQTVIKAFKDSHTQTHVKVLSNTECQTLSTPIVEQDCQTDAPKLSLGICQTDLSIANQVEGGCQATVESISMVCQTENETSEQEIQATVESADSLCQTSIPVKAKGSQTLTYTKTMVAQTELSMLCSSDQECQVGVENNDQECQVGVEINTQDSQTVVSLAFMEEFGVQASVESSEMSLQTEAQPVQGRLVQTDYLGVFAETQTVPDVNNRECQTEDVVVTLPKTVFDEPSLLEAPAQGDIEAHDMSAIADQVTTDENIPPHDVESVSAAPQVALAVPVNENGTQTDPVTIIIGDASFLVQKLKSSSTPPSATQGRQIEVNRGIKGEITQNGGPGTPNTLAGRIRQGRPPRSSFPIYQPQDQNVSPQVENVTQIVGTKQPHVPRLFAGEGTHLSCPFCDLTFHESPALYEHITNSHNEAAAKGHKKPRGREGKTTQRRGRGRGGGNLGTVMHPPYLIPQPVPHRPGMEQRMMPIVHDQIVETQIGDADGPPVLEPVYTFNQMPQQQSASVEKKTRTYQRRTQQEQVMQDPGLFEDLPSPARSYPRNRVRRVHEQEPEEESSYFVHPQLDAYEYECPHCPEKYGSASHLYTHLKRSHKDDMEKIKQEGKPVENADPSEEPEAEVEEEQLEQAEEIALEQQEVVSNTEEVANEVVEEGVEENSLIEAADYVEEDEQQVPEEDDEETASPRKRKRASNANMLAKKQKVVNTEEEAEMPEEGVEENEHLDEEQEGEAEEEDLEEGDEESEINTEDDVADDENTEEDLPNIVSPKRLRGELAKKTPKGKAFESIKKTPKMAVSKVQGDKSATRARRSKRT